LNRNYPINLARQPVKGIFVFHAVDEMSDKAKALFKTLCCQIMTTHDNRFTVKTSRDNLQSIKQRWMDKSDTAISQELNACVARIIIGGAV
jgi:hypothetical protein